MQALAKLAMQSRRNAIMLVVACACLPMIHWLAAALIALIVLRQGINQGLWVMCWACLPTLVMAFFGKALMSNVLSLLITTVFACMLRKSVSWNKTLSLALPVGTVLIALLHYNMSQQIDNLSLHVFQLLAKNKQLKSYYNLTDYTAFQPWIKSLLIGLMAFSYLASAVLFLVLARYWQSSLYHAGEFCKEFHKIRISPPITVLLLVIGFGVLNHSLAIALLPVITLPFAVAGLSLMHAFSATTKKENIWLVFFYTMLILMAQFVYPTIVLVSCLDSFFDFRSRFYKKRL